MSPDELASLWKVVAILGVGNILALVGTWAVLQKRVGDLEKWRDKQETAAKEARAEAERQQEAWWEKVEGLKKGLADLDKVCSNATTETRALLTALKERVDLHSTTTIASLAGTVKNYAEMTEEGLKILRELRAKP